MTIKGQQYAVFPAASGSWSATYAGGAAAASSSARLGASSGLAATRTVSPTTGRTTRQTTKPTAKPVVSGVTALSLPDGTAKVSWRPSEPADPHADFGTVPGVPVSSRQDDDLVRDHEVVLTGLDASQTYWLSARSGNGAGSSDASPWIQLTTRRAGVAMQTSEEFRVGRVSGDLTVSDSGFGALSLDRGGSGSFVSAVLDAQQQVHWVKGLVESPTAPAGATSSLTVRTGDSRAPNASWTDWTPVPESAGGFDLPGRYLQFRLDVSSPQGTAYEVTSVGFIHDGTLPPRIYEGG